MTRPAAKGWCPGAYRPMMSGDGLVVRIRPQLARLSRAQALGLCDLAQRYGSGVIDLTIRANLQIRGVAETDHEALLQALNTLDLLPDDPELEARRNLLVPFDWQKGDDSHSIATALLERLHDFPAMPAKVGFAIDAGASPQFTANSADFRIERSTNGLILRADGLALGRPVTKDAAVEALLELAEWFISHDGLDLRRMKHVVKAHDLPQTWQTTAPLATRGRVTPGDHPMGAIYGAAFGQCSASALKSLLKTSGCSALRVTPWRLFMTEDAAPLGETDFITDAHDPLLAIHACPGKPLCASASVDTRYLARALAGKTDKPLHISGCAKGCAAPRSTALTFVGRDGVFDLVENGKPWDQPSQTGLCADDLTSRIGDL